MSQKRGEGRTSLKRKGPMKHQLEKKKKKEKDKRGMKEKEKEKERMKEKKEFVVHLHQYMTSTQFPPQMREKKKSALRERHWDKASIQESASLKIFHATPYENDSKSNEWMRKNFVQLLSKERKASTCSQLGLRR